MPSLLLLLSSLPAFAADPTIVLPGAAPDESHITVVRTGGSDSLDHQSVAIVLWCAPTAEPKWRYVAENPNANYEAESQAMLAALTERSDISTLVFMGNPTANEITTWFTDFTVKLGNKGGVYRDLTVSVSCLVTDGDTDSEKLRTRDAVGNDGGLMFADFAAAASRLSAQSLWLLDTSRDQSSVIGGPTYGITANDLTGVPNAVAISTGAPGKYAGGGLIGAAAQVIRDTKGGELTFGQLYYSGIKPRVPQLDLYSSLGLVPGDAWTADRKVFVGGPLIVAPKTVTLPKDPIATTSRKKIPPGCYMAGAGVLGLIGAGVTAGQASTHYDKLVLYNNEGGESQSELDEAVDGYRTNTVLAVGLGVLGSAALIGGTTWAILDHGHTTVEVVPTGNGAEIHGKF